MSEESLQELKFKVIGVAHLMMHNERLANPFDQFKKDIDKLTSLPKKSKTEEVLREIMRLEWEGGLYLNDSGAPAVPSDNLLAAIKFGARKFKRGKDADLAIFSEYDFFALDYDGPKDVESMWASGKFLDYRSVCVNGKRVMRSRPIFKESWSFDAVLKFDAKLINEEDLQRWIEVAGAQIGLCERRPKFGRFTVRF